MKTERMESFLIRVIRGIRRPFGRREKRNVWRDDSTPESRALDAQRRRIALARVIEGMRK
jgi:hypothetical protein